MNPAQIIAKKRDGHSLTSDEIAAFVSGYASDAIPDYQMAALAMAVFLNGMSFDEAAKLNIRPAGLAIRFPWYSRR